MEISVATQCYEWMDQPKYYADSSSEYEFGTYSTRWIYRSDYPIANSIIGLTGQFRDEIDHYQDMHRMLHMPRLKYSKSGARRARWYYAMRTYARRAHINMVRHADNVLEFQFRIAKIDFDSIPFHRLLPHVVTIFERTDTVKAYKYLDHVRRNPHVAYRSDIRAKILRAYHMITPRRSIHDDIISPIDYFAPILDAKCMKLLEYDLMLRELSGD
jgi:hypothetical protein